MTDRETVLESGELAPGTVQAIQVGGRAVVVGRTQRGSLFALSDRCPHYGASLSGGRVEEMLAWDDNGTRVLSGRYVVRCPWHRFEFAVESGRCVIDPSKRLRTYTADESDGVVVVRENRPQHP